jgi:cystathionine beta-lyase/cystathionine gamma-synthase
MAVQRAFATLAARSARSRCSTRCPNGAKALPIEALSNPTMRVTDVPALCTLGRQRGVPVIVDATFASPALLRPVVVSPGRRRPRGEARESRNPPT